MAIGHLSAKVFSRSQGHNVISKAAYRAGARVQDERLGKTWDYRRKRHVTATRVLAPEGAPAWVFDRQQLWNRVDAAERRLDSQLARELEISLPRELTEAQQDALIDDFVRDQCVRLGMVADVAIHRPDGNPHAHVMLTMRELTPDGFGRKQRGWNGSELVERWRAEWELAANRALTLSGHQERIEMKSYERRGLDLEPQPKRGRAQADAKHDGRALVAQQTADALATARRNGKAIVQAPQLALLELTRGGNKPTFTPRDVFAFAHRHSADDAQFQEVVRAIRQCPQLVSLGRTDRGTERLTSQAVLQAERELLLDCHLLASRPSHDVPQEAVNDALATAPHELDLPGSLTDEQAAAVRHVTSDAGFAIVEGYAGTGKSTMLYAARKAWERAGYTVVGAALAGKAAEGLEEGSKIPSRTLASWEWQWNSGKHPLSSRHVMVVDEAGMIGTAQFAKLVRTARRTGAKLVVVGDTRQLQAIDPGAPMRLARSQCPAATLSKVVRQRDNPWQAEASREFATGEAKAALQRYAEAGRIHAQADHDTTLDALVQQWQRDRQAAPTDTQLMLAYRRHDVQALNERARAHRRRAGELGEDHDLQTSRGARSFAEGDRIYFLKNDRELSVKNGTLGTIEAIQGATLRVRVDGGRYVQVDTQRYADLDHGYAGTIHKAQGVTVHRAYVLASRHVDASAAYVGMSRHRKDAHLFFSEQEFASVDKLVGHLGTYRMAPSAHEVARQTRLEGDALSSRASFLALPANQRREKIEATERLASSKAPTLEALLEATPEVQQARRDFRAAVKLANSSASSLELVEARTDDHTAPEYRSAAGAHEQAREQLAAAERQLAATVRDPALRRIVQQQRKGKIAQIRRAQHELRTLRALHAEAEKTATLEGLVERLDQRRPGQFRAAHTTDEGVLFRHVETRKFGAEELLVLRHPQGGPLVVTYASRCAPPTDWTRAYEGVRTPAPERERPSRREGPSRGGAR